MRNSIKNIALWTLAFAGVVICVFGLASLEEQTRAAKLNMKYGTYDLPVVTVVAECKTDTT